MLVTMKRNDFGALGGIPLIWACIEPTIWKIRGKNFTIKSDVYSQLTDGQQALLMFQILYGHTLHGVEEFFFYQSYMLSNKGTWSQMINGMDYFGASDTVRFLDELYATYEKFRGDIEQQKVHFGNVEEDTPLFATLNRLDVLLRASLPATINLVSLYIRSNAEKFVKFDDYYWQEAADMENNKFEELHALYISLIPLLQKCNARENNDRSDKLGGKNQVMAIMIIGKAGTISMTSLSKFINMEKGSLTTLIDSLEKMDYVKRLDDPNDRRKKMLALTVEGISQMKVVEEQSKKVFADMISKLNESEIDEMFFSLKSLVKTLHKIS